MIRLLWLLLFFCISHSAWAERLAVLDFNGEDSDLLDLLADQVREAALNAVDNQKISVMTQENMMAMLKGMNKDASCIQGECEVEIGRSIGADYVVTGKLKAINETLYLTLKLHETNKGNLLSSRTIQHQNPTLLIEKVRTESVELMTMLAPQSGLKLFSEGSVGGAYKGMKKRSGKTVIATFQSVPPGAVVIMDGDLICNTTPCSKNVSEGSHLIQMQTEGYYPASKKMRLERGTQVRLTLKPRFGTLNVTSDAAGLAFQINGEQSQKTPLYGLKLDPGPYEARISDPCYVDHGERFLIKEGEEKSIQLKTEWRQAGIAVQIQDSDGNALMGRVKVDGKDVGEAPGEFIVPLCSKGLEVDTDLGRSRQSLQLKEGQFSPIEVVLNAKKNARHQRQRRSSAKRCSAELQKYQQLLNAMEKMPRDRQGRMLSSRFSNVAGQLHGKLKKRSQSNAMRQDCRRLFKSSAIRFIELFDEHGIDHPKTYRTPQKSYERSATTKRKRQRKKNRRHSQKKTPTNENGLEYRFGLGGIGTAYNIDSEVWGLRGSFLDVQLGHFETALFEFAVKDESVENPFENPNDQLFWSWAPIGVSTPVVKDKVSAYYQFHWFPAVEASNIGVHTTGLKFHFPSRMGKKAFTKDSIPLWIGRINYTTGVGNNGSRINAIGIEIESIWLIAMGIAAISGG